MAETELKFDEQKVCTELAAEYLNSKTEFCSMGLKNIQNKDQYEVDAYNNKIYYVDFDYDRSGYIDKTEMYVSKKYLALVHKIEQNAQLFCQLEFLLRNIPINDTKNVDLKLITQSLVHESSFLNSNTIPSHHYVCFGKDTPLFHLGLFAYKSPETRFTIVCSKETVAVGTLFVELCIDAGLENEVALAVVREENFKSYSGPTWVDAMVTFPEGHSFDGALRGGCVGVVTARCDVDSAVDALLAVSTRYPWKLSRVLVQDAAMERFTRALQWKTRDAPAHTLTLELAPNTRSPRAAPVEGYRSAREALALLAGLAPLAVAVWAGDAAEAHELAHGAPAALVWLNGYGRFDGPCAAAAALYCRFALHSQSGVSEELRDRITAWRDLTPLSRFERLHEAIHKIGSPKEIGLSSSGTVFTDDGLCIVIRTPVDCAIVKLDDFEHSLPRFLNYLVEGGAVLIKGRKRKDYLEIIIQSLIEAGAPVQTTNSRTYTSMYTTKAIWMNFGTIFAN